MEAARIKKEGVEEREREEERKIPPLAILPGDAVMYSQSHPPPTGATMNVVSKRLSRTSLAMVAKMYEALKVKSTF